MILLKSVCSSANTSQSVTVLFPTWTMSISNGKISLFVVTFHTDDDASATPQRDNFLSTSTLSWRYWVCTLSMITFCTVLREKAFTFTCISGHTLGKRQIRYQRMRPLQAQRSLDIWKWEKQALRPESDNVFHYLKSPQYTEFPCQAV